MSTGISFSSKRGSFGSKRGRWRMASSLDDPVVVVGGDMGKQEGGKRQNRSNRRLSDTTKGTERTRSRGSFFGSFSVNSSEHTGLTDPVSSDEEARKQQNKKQNKKRRKLRLGKLFCFGGETETKQKKGDRYGNDRSRIADETETHNMESYELGLSQEDIADWVREQRTKCVERNASREFRSQKAVEEIRMSSSSFATEDIPALDSISPLTPSPSSQSLLQKSNSSLSSNVPPIQEQPIAAESTNSSSRQIEAAVPVKTPSQREIQTSAQQTTRTIHMPRMNRRPKTELDITGHTSFSVEETEKKTKSMRRKKSKPKESLSSSRSLSSQGEPVNSRRKYPSKKGQRKPARKNSVSNRVDFAGGISTSNSFEPPPPPPADEETSSTMADEMTRLRSLVDLMMTRMEVYEKQSDSLPTQEASSASAPTTKKSKKAKEGTVENNNSDNKPKSKKKKTKKKRPTDHQQTPGTTTTEANVDQWITKLEEMQNVYQERLDLTTNQLEALKENQAETNKRIIADYQQRLEAKNKKKESPPDDSPPKEIPAKKSRPKKSQPKDSPPKIPKKEGEKIDSTNRSKSNLSSRSNGKSVDEESSLWDSSRIDYNAETDESAHTISTRSSTRSDRSVRFSQTVQVSTCLSRYEMNPKEKFSYWSGDGDEDMSDDLIKMLTEKWTVRKQIENVELGLIASKKGEKKILGEDTPLPSHLVSDCIKQRLPASEREGNDGYTYTIGIQDLD